MIGTTGRLIHSPSFLRACRTARLGIRAALSMALLTSCSSSTASCTYLHRFVFWSPSGAQDWGRFPARAIGRADVPFRYPEDPRLQELYVPLLREVTYSSHGQLRTAPLDTLLADTGSTAFIVIKDGVLVRETYLNGHTRDSMTRAFSATKTFTASLIGVALSEGRIRSADDPFVDYLPELRGRGYDGITIRHLLLMAGGFRFSYGRFPWADSPLMYWHPDIRRVILDGPPLTSRPGERFNYSSYSSAVLGMVLERVVGCSISDYFERVLWKPMGAEYDSTWSLDHDGSGLEYAASGLNGSAIDLVKLGTLYLNGGRWGDRQILPANWALESVTPLSPELPGHTLAEKSEHIYYKFGWWGHDLGGGHSSFFAEGHLGQVIYVYPDKKLVIARFGSTTGGVDRWPALLCSIAEKFP